MVTIETGPWQALGEAARGIRYAVFVIEQGVPAELELDANDAAALHAVARAADGRAVGTGRLLPDGHIGRMAVLPDWRGRGVGSAILATLVAAARARGDAVLRLSAQTHALGFYRRHGFTEEGPEYLEAGIAHRRMRLRLQPEASRNS